MKTRLTRPDSMCTSPAAKLLASTRSSSCPGPDGRTVACDYVLVGVGVTPNDELAKDCGLETVPAEVGGCWRGSGRCHWLAAAGAGEDYADGYVAESEGQRLASLEACV